MEPSAQCGYNYSRDFGEEPFSDEGADCLLPATHHVLWTGNGSSVACEGHYNVVRARGSARYKEAHPFGDHCLTPGALWAISINRCFPAMISHLLR